MNEPQTARRAYFGAADATAGAQPAASTTRQQLAQDLIAKAGRVAEAVKTARAFDHTGHVLDAMPNLGTAVDDLNGAYRALVQDVARFVGRDPQTAEAHAATRRLIGAGLFSQELAADLEASIRRHPAGSALAELDAAEAAAAGEPPLPAPLAPKPAPGPFRRLADRPQA